jgi:predicted transcriptional regulator
MISKTETIEVDSDTATALRTRAAERGISVSQVVAELVPFAIEESDIAELVRRWAAVQAGRPTVPDGDVERWLQSWGTADFRPWSGR